MSSSTSMISGLVSGFDWRSVVDQLIAIDQKKVDLLKDRQGEYKSKLTEWQSVNTMLLSLKTASAALADVDAFNVFAATTTSNTSTDPDDLFTVSTSASASSGTYSIKVNRTAQSEKISSKSYSAKETALSLSGDIIISGRAIEVVSTDTLTNIRDKINALNTGSDPSNVTASIVQHSSTDYHLVLTSDETGVDGIEILEGSSAGVLQSMGFIASTVQIKTATSDGAMSSAFSNSSTEVGTLLGLTSAPGATSVTIGGNSVSISLADDSITDIAAKIDALAGISASVVSEVIGGETKYRIDVSGTTSFTDNGNVLQILGVLEGTYGEINEMHTGDVQRVLGTGAAITAASTFADLFTGALRGATQNMQTTAAGGGYISSTTQWNLINTGGDANDIDIGDSIRVQGTTHSGAAVDATYNIADNTEQLSNFLSWVETQYGGATAVDAYLDSTGRLIVQDLAAGASQLSVGPLTYTGTALSFGSFGNNISNSDTVSISGTRYNAAGAYETFSSIYTITTTDQISNLLAEIETQYNKHATDHHVSAYVSDGTDGNTAGQIVLKDLTAGDSQLALSLIANNQGGGTLNFGAISQTTEGRDMQITAGQDAEIVVDGVTMQKSSNSIDDVIAGVTLNLTGASSSTTVTLNVSRNLSSIKSKITTMTSSFNTLMTYINKQFSYDEKTSKTGGILFGDGTLYTVKSELIDAVTSTVTGVSEGYNRLPLIGISLNDDVNLTVDDEDLTDALETNFNDVKKLFIALGSSANSQFQYVGHTENTEGGTYSTVISTAATRSTVTGANSLAGTLGADETLTIEDLNALTTGAVTLTAGMDIDDVVNAINSEMEKTYTEQLQGSNNTGFTAATLFSDIAGAENGDVISFTGTKRNGLAVSGSYTVGTSQNLGALLSEIEDTFDNEVTASMSGGKIVITDKQSGASQLTLNIDSSSVSGLDFGVVSVFTSGRNAMRITASKTAENKVLLTHNSYGTGHMIGVSESGGAVLGLTNAAATKVWGMDVAGKINGIDATGKGQVLTLSSSGNNADGLSILYTGTTAQTADFTLTLGIADILDRQLGFITDSTDGYVAFKQTSLDGSIESYDDQIELLEATLARKQEQMINRFVAMELALSKIQNQSNWLASQINAAQNMWE
ncbi:MAG TPA: flagellar filament capping protein FliD [Syntrophales bacterium]|nr:flagellar filament capping protein FliD [Syntrophales bacterium]